MAKKRKKQKRWVKLRHRVITGVARIFFAPYVSRKYGVKVDKFQKQGDRAYLILLNHQTAYDQFFVGMAFRGPVYYVASEDIFSLGFVSKLLKYAVAPIPIKKQATDVSSVLTCARVAREGGTIALAPEGNRTYSGKTEYMNPAIAKLAHALKMPIAFFKIEGGYGVHPRWADDVRKGKMRAYVSRVMEVEEMLALSPDALYEEIRKELFVREDCVSGEFVHENLAQYLERAIYVCPDCGLSVFESKKDLCVCKKCGKTVRYNKDKTLSGVGEQFPFAFVNEWYEYQNQFVRNLDLAPYAKTPAYTDNGVEIFSVQPYKKKTRLQKSASLSVFADKFVIFGGENQKAEGAKETHLPFEKVTAISVLGKNKLNVYLGERVYQVRGDERFNALKYVNLYYHAKNIAEGKGDVEFLGL